MEGTEAGHTGEAVLKVEGGKMLRVMARLEGGRITGPLVTGDFFLHPEEAILRLEAALDGLPPEPAVLLSAATDALEDAELIGASPSDVVRALLMAVGRDGDPAGAVARDPNGPIDV